MATQGEIIQVEGKGVTIALGRMQLNLQRREEMYSAMGAVMLVSIRRTFREQGSPAGSWVPLAASTIASNPKKYGAGHKLLVDRGTLLNSITFAVTTTGVSIGTNLKYAAVHQFGSRDRTGGPFGPQAKIEGRGVLVYGHTRTIKLAPRYEMREVTTAAGKKARVPFKVFQESKRMTDRRGHTRTVVRNIPDLGITQTHRVTAHRRHQNIPARPYLVFRPEDPQRLRAVAVQFNNKAIADAGLGKAA